MAPRLYLNHIADYDWLIALEFGRVDDAQPPENWRGVSEKLGVLHDGPDGPAVGFKLVDASEFDTEDPEVADAIWRGPRFDVPVLGLTDAAIGEIILAARALFGEGNSIHREYFHAATEVEGQEALDLWLAALQEALPRT